MATQHFVIVKDGSKIFSFKSVKGAAAYVEAEAKDGFQVTDDTKSLKDVPLDVLVTIYNTIRPEKPVKKFADRATAHEKMRGVLEVLAKPGPQAAVVGDISPKTPKAPRDPNAPKAPRVGKLDDHTIEFISKENPRKPGTSGHRSRELAKEGMTVAEFVAAGGVRRDLEWDVEKGWTKLNAPSGTKAEPVKEEAKSDYQQLAEEIVHPTPEPVAATGTDDAKPTPRNAPKKGAAKEQAARRSGKRK